MLFLPLLDHGWRIPPLPRSRPHILAWIALLMIGIVLLDRRPSEMPFALATSLTAALPEEWFFRGYFMVRLGNGIRTNLAASLLFSLLHGLTRDWITAALVFVPSLFYGWLFQRTRDVLLLTLVHALSNLAYAMFLAQFLTTLIGDLR